MSASIEPYFNLLKQMISTPSLSKEEEKVSTLLCDYFRQKEYEFTRIGNNIILKNKYYTPSKPTILLNSHIDTVKPNSSYTLDPFDPRIDEGKLYGLGSNDAGGCLVSLVYTFDHFYATQDLPYNLILVVSAEEEISGKNGMIKVIEYFERKKIDLSFAIIGEPTQMQSAIAEKGLMVLDITVNGIAGHAAREEGINAISRSMEVIQYFHTFSYQKTSPLLGPIKATVTMIEAGTQHNVIPDTCQLVVDIRTTDVLTNGELLDIFKKELPKHVNIHPRGTLLNASHIDINHPFVKICATLGNKLFGSPTLSDQALIPYPSLKMGPGNSARSHTKDEFIFLNEIRQGCAKYIELLTCFFESQGKQ